MSLSDVQYTGHGSNTGGLQRHSIGESYPFAVVGTHHRHPDGTNTKETRYYIVNLITGQKLYFLGPCSEKPRTFISVITAHDYAALLAKGDAIIQQSVKEVA